MYPVLLNLGPVTIYSYGVMMALSFVAAGWVISKELERQGRDPDLASTLVLWAAVGGLLGARVLFILDAWQAFVDDPWSTDDCSHTKPCVNRLLGKRQEPA